MDQFATTRVKAVRPRAALFLAAVCLVGAEGPAFAAVTASTVAVAMSNGSDGAQMMRLDRQEVTAGRISFKVKNESATLVHEFLLVRTQLKRSSFP